MNKEYIRICRNCNIEQKYTRKWNFDIANKENKLCYNCKTKERKGKPEDWYRNCPNCNKIITYTTKSSMTESNKTNKTCLKCSKNEIRINTKFEKECPECKNKIFYKNKASLNDSIIHKSKCKLCVSKEAIKRQTGLGNKGMLLLKYGEIEGEKKWKESEIKRIISLNKYWEENPEQYNNLIEKRKSFKCKFFYINNIKCQGTSEKYYIENLIKENKELPKKPKGILTPNGYYFPDFEFNNSYIEIKSEYTYKILKKENNIQYLKIKWVAKNIKPIEIIISDFYKSKIYLKEILIN